MNFSSFFACPFWPSSSCVRISTYAFSRVVRSELNPFATNDSWSASRVLIGPGSKLLLFALIKALPAAEILIPAPAWVSYAPQARLAGQTAIKLAASFETRWQITPEQLEAVDNVWGWQLDEAARTQIEAIVDRHVVDPVGPEFMAPPARET